MMVVPAALLLLVLVVTLGALLQRTAIAAQRLTIRRGWHAIDEEFVAEPLVAYKTAQIMVSPDGRTARFVGITAGVAYEAVAAAVCPRAGCRPPATDCYCGFYAFKRHDDAIALLYETLAFNGLRHKAVLTVELEGSVLQYELGYRAERQTVLGIAFSGLCHCCEQRRVSRRAVVLAAAPSYRMLPLPSLDFGARPEPLPAAMPLRPVCREHIPTDPCARTFTPSELSGLLGTDVEFLTEGDAASAA